MDSLQGEQFCPRCAAEMAASSASQGAAIPTFTCPACGLVISAADLAKFDYLGDVETWAAATRAWIIDVAATGGRATDLMDAAGQPAGIAASTPTSVRDTAQVGSTPTAAGCLLATGVFALFAAALAFTAFAWDTLGAFGQLMVLMVAGAGSLVGGYKLSRRLAGTANALSVAGVLLLVVAAGFWLDADSLGSPHLRAAAVAVVSVGLVAASYVQARRQPGAAVFTATVFAVLAFVTVLVAPTLGRDEVPTWFAWWAAAVAIAWGGSLLVLDVATSRRAWQRVPWSWLGIFGVVIGAVVSSVAVVDEIAPTDWFAVDWAALLAVVSIVWAMALLLLDRVTRARWLAAPAGSMILFAAAALALMGALDDPSSRPWSAMAGLGLVVGLVAAAAHLRARPTMSAQPPADPSAFVMWAVGLIRLAAATVAASVALLLSPWPDAPGPFFDECFTYPCVKPAYTSWLADSYPWWSGVLTGAVATLAAALVVVLLRVLKREQLRDLPAIVGVGILALWSLILFNAATGFDIDGSVVQPAATAALVIGGLGLLVTFWAGRVPTVALWLAAGFAAAGGQVAWTWLEVESWSVAPELHGLFVGLPLLLAGMIILLTRPDEEVSTWVSVGPALFAVLVFPVAAVVEDAFSGGSGTQLGLEAAIRLVAVLVVSSVLVVLGARNHWAAPFWSGLVAIVIVVGSQMLDLASLLPQWVSLAIVGVILLVAGARWESVRLRGRRTRQWAGTLR